MIRLLGKAHFHLHRHFGIQGSIDYNIKKHFFNRLLFWIDRSMRLIYSAMQIIYMFLKNILLFFLFEIRMFS